MKIKKEDIQHIAELARIDLNVEELEQYQGQLGDILDYVGQLNKVNTKDVQSTAQVSELNNIWRSDDIKNWDRAEIDSALNQGEVESNQVKVKKIL